MSEGGRSPPKYVPWGRTGGVLCCLLFGLTGFLGSIFIHGPILPLMFIWPWLYRRLVEIATSMWEALMVATLEKVLRVKVVITGDEIRRHEKTLVIMNHRTRVDWMFFFCCAFHCRILNRQKITLKSMLKWIPGIGWSMQVGGFIFLDRIWEKDKEHISNMLHHLVSLDSKPNYLFFPEGTDLTERTKMNSDSFAQKNDLPPYDYVLHPRTTGFVHMVNTLRQYRGIQAVHDVTVAYPRSMVQNEMQILVGEVPQEVHFHIKRYSIEDIPEDEEGLSDWCKTRWDEKEKMLRSYYNDESDGQRVQSVTAGRRFPNNKIPPLSNRNFLQWFCITAWLLFLILSIYLIMTSLIARWYSVMIILFYIIQGWVVGGVEKLEMMVCQILREYRGEVNLPVSRSNIDIYERILKDK